MLSFSNKFPNQKESKIFFSYQKLIGTILRSELLIDSYLYIDTIYQIVFSIVVSMTIGYIICCFFQISVFKTGRPLVDDLVDLIDKYLQIVITTMIVYYSVRSQFRSSFNGSSLICHSTFSRRFRHFVLLTIYQFKMHFNEFLLIEFFLYLISRKK